MSSGICDKLQTILDFADTRAACRLNPGQEGLGNVMATPIGFVRNGQTVTGFLPTYPVTDRCQRTPRTPARGVC